MQRSRSVQFSPVFRCYSFFPIQGKIRFVGQEKYYGTKKLCISCPTNWILPWIMHVFSGLETNSNLHQAEKLGEIVCFMIGIFSRISKFFSYCNCTHNKIVVKLRNRKTKTKTTEKEKEKQHCYNRPW